MSQEDDLRALAKIMDFLRAVSIILVVMNVYLSLDDEIEQRQFPPVLYPRRDEAYQGERG